jgi:uncharacterized cofD-like protein
MAGRLTAVVTVADDGGSSGRLRNELGVLPPGDLRMALAALCGDDDWGRTWAKVLQHRFAGGGELHDHAAGNLLIVALWELLGGHVEGLDWVARLLGAQGRVLPMSLVPIDIEAFVGGPPGRRGKRRDIRTVAGQHAVATTEGDVVAVRLVPEDPPACPEALDAIADADWVVFGPGSWFSSVIPHVLLPQLRHALMSTSARRAVTLNLSAEGETTGFTPEMHLEVLAAYAPDLRLDLVIAERSSTPSETLLRRVSAEMGAELVITDVAMGDGSARHDPERLGQTFAKSLGRGGVGPWH